MCDVGYLCADFGLPRPLCYRLRPDVRDIQTDVRQKHRLMPPPIRGGGITTKFCTVIKLDVRTISPRMLHLLTRDLLTASNLLVSGCNSFTKCSTQTSPVLITRSQQDLILFAPFAITAYNNGATRPTDVTRPTHAATTAAAAVAEITTCDVIATCDKWRSIYARRHVARTENDDASRRPSNWRIYDRRPYVTLAGLIRQY